MKLVSFGPAGKERPGALVGGRVIDLLRVDGTLPPTVRGILESGLLPRVREIVGGAPPAGSWVEAASVRLGPPVTNPSKIVCLGRNYQDHAAEQNREVPSSPLLFAKGPNALCGDGDSVPYPRGVTELDWEIELAFVIGRRAKHVDVEEAYRHVAGYGVFMDISARDLQRSEKQWFRAKSVDGSGPFGPWLVTADDIADPHDLDISIDVNGETMQSSNTGRMFFKIDFIIHHITQSITLEPGDIVATGTPSGVGVFRDPPVFLGPGDRLEGRIESLGTLRCSIGPAE
jgi:2-keto-4-pentenoate hydratase/2-oxohepta-3-ene-1,7-dioic acid hydratase in catechol pathway